MVAVHGRRALALLSRARTLPESGPTWAAAPLAGLAAASVTNLFSSVHYNGVLIAFVLVLALVAGTPLAEEASHAHG
jgi:hypothetical protein